MVFCLTFPFVLFLFGCVTRVAVGGYFAPNWLLLDPVGAENCQLAPWLIFKLVVLLTQNGFICSSVVKTLLIIPLLFYMARNSAIISNDMATLATFGVSSGAFSRLPNGNPVCDAVRGYHVWRNGAMFCKAGLCSHSDANVRIGTGPFVLVL
uniref:Uncharacterized protein n=1 Tax=Rhipicephalus zambeziensis TaxID=60191 RepID=A0A224YH03_9ACAR